MAQKSIACGAQGLLLADLYTASEVKEALNLVRPSCPGGGIMGRPNRRLGMNGTGKSTLLRAVAGEVTPPDGEIFVDSRRIDTLAPREKASLVAVVSTLEVRVPHLLVRDVVSLGRAPYTNWLGTLRNRDRRAAARALDVVGMSEFARSELNTLSDGERQRVMIARALAQNTPVILLDEPTSFLDQHARNKIFTLLQHLAHDENKTVLCATHDLDLAERYCNTLLTITDMGLH